MIYIEPTPYIVCLIEELCRQSAHEIRVSFLTKDATQPWNVRLPENCELLPGKWLRSFMALRSRLKFDSVSILHLAGWGHPKLLTAMLLGWFYRVPVVIETDTQAPFKISRTKRLVKRFVFPWLFKIPACFLPGGSRQARYLRDYGVSERSIHIAQMTVDVESIMAYAQRSTDEQRATFKDQMNLHETDKVFLYVGRLEPHKGIMKLIHTFEELTATDRSAKLLMVGDGSLKDSIAKWVENTDWLLAPGRLSGEQLLAAYYSADVFVLPSEFESWGLVVNEAMATGLPVIASDRVGCADDLILGKDTGVVYDFDNRDGLFEALRLLLDDPTLRKRFGENARALISSWTLQEEAERIMKAWSDIT